MTCGPVYVLPRVLATAWIPSFRERHHVSTLCEGPQCSAKVGHPPLPVFAMSGVSCFLPYSGKHRLNLYESRYLQMHQDMVSEQIGKGCAQSRQELVVVYQPSGQEAAPIGVIMELLHWSEVEPRPRISAVFAARSRARIHRVIDVGRPGSNANYQLANIEFVDDSPGVEAHEEIRAALSTMWKILGQLAELQAHLKQRPALAPTVLKLGSKGGVLSASDVWQPITFVQELHVRQARATHSKYEKLIAEAVQKGAPTSELEQAYDAELDRLRMALERFPLLLTFNSMTEILAEVTEIARDEVQRLETLLRGSRGDL